MSIDLKFAQLCQPYTCLYLSWMRSTFSGFLTLKNSIFDNYKNLVRIQPVEIEIEFPAEDNNQKNGKNDDEGDGDQDHGVVDEHPGGENT